VSLKCCLKHCKGFDYNTFLNSVGSDGLNPHRVMFQLLAAGRRPPDFDRVFIQPVPLDSPAAQQFDRMRNANQSVSAR